MSLQQRITPSATTYVPGTTVSIPHHMQRYRAEPRSMGVALPWDDPIGIDLAALTFQSELRRLTAVAQIDTLENDGRKHNRYTHSHQVAALARQLGGWLGCDTRLVEIASLLHDIGHPPFGHNGERALNNYLIVNGDPEGFEGNAQTFRIQARLGLARLNLTFGAMDATMKYPWTAAEAHKYKPGKFGCYEDDADVFRKMREGAPEGRSCLEAQIMDWADTVAYISHDLEDLCVSQEEPLIPIRAIFDDEGLQRELAQKAAKSHCKVPADRVLGTFQEFAAHNGRLLTYLSGSETREKPLTAEERGVITEVASNLRTRLLVHLAVATKSEYGDAPLSRYGANLCVPEEVDALQGMFQAATYRFVVESSEFAKAQEAEHLLLRTVIDILEAKNPVLQSRVASPEEQKAARRSLVDEVASMTDDEVRQMAEQGTASSRPATGRPVAAAAVRSSTGQLDRRARPLPQ